MGERDKGWIEVQGRPLIELVLARFAPQVGRVVISANRNLERYAGLGFDVVPDLRPGFPGPLAGLQAAFRATSAELLAAVPCDSPFLPLDLVARLEDALRGSGAQLAVARTQGRMHPVFCLCSGSVQESLDHALAAGQRRLETWCRSLPLVEVAFDDAQAFRNLNEPGDLDG
jgi:molybdopterin-guanine dinucleotide biosynthesis protein A